MSEFIVGVSIMMVVAGAFGMLLCFVEWLFKEIAEMRERRTHD